ncbi:hypothetical protein ACFO0N_10935 [Halobium salinum]|uniref:DUF4239 domain-containing protein n=1 Tax=Halobium salinum TaxID=1364940 RepID=A0ABD5PCL6_9EURY|nr:hypothetical protein [Halobium salinum]
MSSEDISTADTMRERTDESRIKLWILLQASRIYMSLALAVVLFVVFVLAGTFMDPPFAVLVRGSDTIETAFSSMLGAVITAVTLVVSVSQLVISQENGPLGDQHQRMSDAMDFRSFTEEIIGQEPPADPSHFLRVFVDESERRAKALQRLVEETDDEEFKREVDTLVDSLHGNGEAVRDQLEGSTFGTFEVVFAALNYNYSSKIYHVERMRHEYEDTVDDGMSAAMSDLRTALSMFGPAREHVKTLYFQWSLMDLSQVILYAAVPALIVAGAMLGFVGPNSFQGSLLGVNTILWVFAAAFTVTAFPFLAFIVYIVRIATVAKRTLAIDPLILRDSQR